MGIIIVYKLMSEIGNEIIIEDQILKKAQNRVRNLKNRLDKIKATE